MSSGDLNKRRLGALKELGQAGIAQGAAALSQLTGERVGMCDARLKTSVGGRLSELIDGESGAVAAMRIEGEGGGKILVAFSQASAGRLLTCLLRRPGEGLLHTEDGASTLKETANIIGCAYLNVLSDMTGMMLLPSPPELVVGSQTCRIPPSRTSTSAEGLAVETHFFIGDVEADPIRGHFYLIPDDSFLERLLLTSARHL